MLEEQRAAIEAHLSLKPRHILPITDPIKAEVDHPSSVFRGHTVGCIVMAGGQATRLGGTAPKGTIPFSPVSGKSLLQIIAEKVVAFSRCYGSIARLAIMTSEATDEATKTLFAAHHNFGINRVDFFLQSSRPLLDMDKNPITTSDGKLLTGPDGNGGVFREFVA